MNASDSNDVGGSVSHLSITKGDDLKAAFKKTSEMMAWCEWPSGSNYEFYAFITMTSGVQYTVSAPGSKMYAGPQGAFCSCHISPYSHQVIGIKEDIIEINMRDGIESVIVTTYSEEPVPEPGKVLLGLSNGQGGKITLHPYEDTSGIRQKNWALTMVIQNSFSEAVIVSSGKSLRELPHERRVKSWLKRIFS